MDPPQAPPTSGFRYKLGASAIIQSFLISQLFINYYLLFKPPPPRPGQIPGHRAATHLVKSLCICKDEEEGEAEAKSQEGSEVKDSHTEEQGGGSN